MTMEMKVDVMESKRLLDNFLTIDQDMISHTKYNGQQSKPLKRLVVAKQNSIGVLLYHKDKKTLILVEQFRYPAWKDNSGRMIEIVAGNIDNGETIRQTVCREVLEETGYEIHELRPIGNGYSSPGILTEKLYLFYAEVTDRLKTDEGGGLDDEGEDIRIVEWSVEQAWQRLINQEVTDLKSLVALQWFFLHRSGTE